MKKLKQISFLLSLVALGAQVAPLFVLANEQPELPRIYLDTSLVSPTGKTIEVRSGGNLQAALDAAVPGDEVVIESGAEFVGSFTLKKKTGQGVITVRSSDIAHLPLPGERVNPSLHAGAMAKLKSPGKNLPALTAENGVSGYRIVGIEFTKASSDAAVTNLVIFGQGNETSINDLPKNIILDRIYAHGDSNSNLRRCIALNGASLSVIDSYIADCHEVGADSQAIAGWNGPGPFKIVNNFLEGAGENILFGGADPSISGLIPSDIEIRQNHIYKPLSWKSKSWVVKNLFETKNAKRVLFDGNLLENSWPNGQTGTAILLKSANQDGKCSWCVSSDITISNTIARNVTEGLRINGAEGSPLPPKVTRVKFTNVLFEGVTGKILQIFNGTSNVTFENVTAYSPESILFGDVGNGSTNPGLVIKDTVIERGLYGIGAGSEEGKMYLNKWFPNSVVENLVLINLSEVPNDKLSSSYPPGTTVVKDRNQIPSGQGVNMSKINTAMKASVQAPVPVPKPTPSPTANPSPTPTPVDTGSASSGSTRSSSASVATKPSQELEKFTSLPQVPTIAVNTTREDLQKQLDNLLFQLKALQSGTNPLLAGYSYDAAPVATSSFARNLTVGSAGSDVVTLQQMLASKGFLRMPPGTPFGYFGVMTRTAVVHWQAVNSIPATGFFGPMSRARASQ